MWSPDVELQAEIEERSMPEPNTGCWLWMHRATALGYPQMSGDGGYAHRASYRAFNGPLADRDVVRHRCDTPRCVNPDHLLVGTQGDNLADMRARQRNARGSRHGLSKLKDKDIYEIRALRERNLTYAQIGEAVGISQSMVGFIVTGKNWRHL